MESTYGIHKLHANYGKVFSEWSSIEDSMADYLQMAGHHMDKLAHTAGGNVVTHHVFKSRLHIQLNPHLHIQPKLCLYI